MAHPYFQVKKKKKENKMTQDVNSAAKESSHTLGVH